MKKMLYLSYDEAIEHTTIDIYSLCSLEVYEEYLNEVGFWDFHPMEDLDQELRYYSPHEILSKIPEGEHFDTSYDYFYFNRYGKIKAMTSQEYRQHVIESIDREEFLIWAVWGGMDDETILTAIAENLKEQFSVQEVKFHFEPHNTLAGSCLRARSLI